MIGIYLDVRSLLAVMFFINTVGTFGIASASYYWSRVAAAVGRLVQYLSAETSTSWHMLVADDYLLESGGPEYRVGFAALLCFVRRDRSAVIMAQDVWRRHAGLGWFRVVAALSFCWYLGKESRVVCQMGRDGSHFNHDTYGDFRRGAWSDHVRGWRA